MSAARVENYDRSVTVAPMPTKRWHSGGSFDWHRGSRIGPTVRIDRGDLPVTAPLLSERRHKWRYGKSGGLGSAGAAPPPVAAVQRAGRVSPAGSRVAASPYASSICACVSPSAP